MHSNWFKLIILWSFLLLSACGGSSGSAPAHQAGVQMGGSIQGKALSLSRKVTTIAGLSSGIDGTGSSARFIAPADIATDGTSLYVTDGDNTIRKVVIATGKVTTLAGTPGVYGSADGIGAAASFNRPRGIVTDGTNLYVADSQNEKIRKIEIATGVVTTLAGSGNHGSVDGIGGAAGFSIPTEMTTDGTYLYVSEWGSSGSLRKVEIATAKVTTLIPNVYHGGITTNGKTLFVADTPSVRTVDTTTGAISSLYLDTGYLPPVVSPVGLTTDGSNIYFADGHDGTIRKVVIATGLVTTVAGHAGASSTVDGTGVAAGFLLPTQITTDGTNLYVIDDRVIRKVAITTGEVTTLAGKISTSDDGIGKDARFRSPAGMTTDGENLFVTDRGRIRQVTVASGTVTTLSVSPVVSGNTHGTATSVSLGGPRNITTDGTNLYVTDTSNYTIGKIEIATGVATTIAGTPGVSGSVDGTGSNALFSSPWGITTDGTHLFVTDGNTIRKVVIATGVVTTLAGTPGVLGSTDGIGSVAAFYFPVGLTTDGANLYVADFGNRTIRQIVIATGAVSTLAGSAGVYGFSDGTGTAAAFRNPTDITTDGTYLYVSDFTTIRKIGISTGTVTTLAGGSMFGAVDGMGEKARFYAPSGLATDGKSLFVVDAGSFSIRKID